MSETLDQVARILNHTLFTRSIGPARLLMHLAEQLDRNAGRPSNQRELATALGLPSNFDPVSNPLVRMHMTKLRRKLERYYAEVGRDDAVVLAIPRKCYRLQSHVREDIDSGHCIGSDGVTDSSPPNGANCRHHILITEFPGDGVIAKQVSQQLAFWLAAELVAKPDVSAVGPLPGDSSRNDHSDHARLADVARKCSASHYVNGTVAKSQRGIEVGVKLIDAKTREVVWTSWFDDPADATRDETETMVRRLATRIADLILRSPLTNGNGNAHGSPSTHGAETVGSVSSR